MNPVEAHGWLSAISELLAVARANWGTVALLAALASLFGFRLGPRDKPWIEVHGLLRSLWVGAQGIGALVDALLRIEHKVDGIMRRFDRRFPVADSIPPPSRPGSLSEIQTRG